MYLGGTSLSGDFLRSLVYSMSMREAELDVDVDEPLDEVEDWALNPASEGVRDKLYLHRCRLANLDKLSLDITDLDEFVDTRESMIRERCHDVAFVKAQLSREVTSLWAAFGNKLNQVVGKRQTTRTFGRGVYVNLLQSLEPVNAFTLRLNERIELMELCRTRIQSGLRVTAKWKKHLGQAEEAWSHIPTSTLDEESQNVFLSPSAFHDYDNCANTAAEVKGRMLASFVRSQASAALEAVNEAIENDKKLLAIRDIMEAYLVMTPVSQQPRLPLWTAPEPDVDKERLAQCRVRAAELLIKLRKGSCLGRVLERLHGHPVHTCWDYIVSRVMQWLIHKFVERGVDEEKIYRRLVQDEFHQGMAERSLKRCLPGGLSALPLTPPPEPEVGVELTYVSESESSEESQNISESRRRWARWVRRASRMTTADRSGDTQEQRYTSFLDEAEDNLDQPLRLSLAEKRVVVRLENYLPAVTMVVGETYHYQSPSHINCLGVTQYEAETQTVETELRLDGTAEVPFWVGKSQHVDGELVWYGDPRETPIGATAPMEVESTLDVVLRESHIGL